MARLIACLSRTSSKSGEARFSFSMRVRGIETSRTSSFALRLRRATVTGCRGKDQVGLPAFGHKGPHLPLASDQVDRALDLGAATPPAVKALDL
jgi:hypothetical protein